MAGFGVNVPVTPVPVTVNVMDDVNVGVPRSIVMAIVCCPPGGRDSAVVVPVENEKSPA